MVTIMKELDADDTNRGTDVSPLEPETLCNCGNYPNCLPDCQAVYQCE